MSDNTPLPPAVPGDDESVGQENDTASGDADAPTGGDELTEDNLQADNAVEEDMLRALDPGAPSA